MPRRRHLTKILKVIRKKKFYKVNKSFKPKEHLRAW